MYIRMYQRRRQLSAAETAANAERKAARDRATMTCQCCGRRYLANKGMIAHHGYQRPGGGWQTASCMGARELPFENDREALGKLLDHLKQNKAHMIQWWNAVANETNGFTLSYTDYSKPHVIGRGRPSISFTVTRATFDAMVAEHKPNVRHRSIGFWNSFDVEKANELKSRDREIANITDEINFQQKRFDGWIKTHGWDTREIWIKI